MAYGRHSRKKRDVHQFIFDDYTKCKGLTQEEFNEDLGLLKLAQYTTPSTKYKISNPISKQKRELITSIYDKKNISCDLAKDNNQLIRDLNALKKQIQKIKDDIVHNHTQITISNLRKEMVEREFELVQQNKNKQIESLQKYQNQCKNNIAQIETELSKLIPNTTQSATADLRLSNALQYIIDLKSQLKNKKEIINILKQNEISSNKNNADIFELNEKINNLEKKNTEQRKRNTSLRTENKRQTRELEEYKESYRNLIQIYKGLNHELSKTKYEANNELNRSNQEKIENEHKMKLIENERIKYQKMAISMAAQQHDNQVLNAAISIDYYNGLLFNDGLKKGNKILQNSYNELENKYKELNEKYNSNIERLSVYELEHIILEQNKKNQSLSLQLHEERQKYVQRVFQFKDDLDALYRKTEGTAKENIKMKENTKKKTFELQRENDKLRFTLKQSHSNLRVKQTETEAKHKQKEEQHKERVKVMNGSKLDLEKRVDVLKSAIKDLNGALTDCHIQMLTFQKQVFDEMNCSIPKDDALIINKNKKRNKKRPNTNTEISNEPNTKRRKIDVDSSSSSIDSTTDDNDQQYTFQGALTNTNNNIHYSILTNTKTDGYYVLLNDYIKITRKGHPDYTGRVESMFYDQKYKKKKVCVTIFQLISDIPNIAKCSIINGNNNDNERFEGAKREYVQLILSPKHKQFKEQKENTKIFGVGRIHTNKKVTLWFPKRHLQFKAIEKKTSGRDVYFCRYKYDKNNKTLTRIDGTDDQPQIDYQ